MRRASSAVAGACLLLVGLGAASVHAQAPVTPAAPQGVSITVCAPGTSGPNCVEGIQQAIVAAGDNGVVTIPAGEYTTPEIVIEQDVTVRGAGPANTILQAASGPCVEGQQHRVLRIVGAYVRLEGFTVRNGCSEYTPGDPISGLGGGIYSSGTVLLKKIAIRNNAVVAAQSAPPGTEAPVARGGGLYSTGYLSIDSSSIADNAATGGAGGGQGGGWYNRGLAEAANLSVLSNRADGGGRGFEAGGGGLFNEGMLEVTHGTLFRNETTGGGGGLYNTGEVMLRNSAITKNSALANPDTACNTIFGKPFEFGQQGVNYLGVPGCSPAGGVDAETPLDSIGVVAVYDGLPVLALKPGSPLVDLSPCLAAPTDALGTARPKGLRCDAGAYEANFLFMPALVRGPDLPNLKVTDISVEPGGAINNTTYAIIRVTVSNLGRLSTDTDFWVDLYINPKAAPPLSAGTPWSYLCRNSYCKNDHGVSWRVARRLDVGESLVLTSIVKAVGNLRPDINIAPDQTQWMGYFKPGYTELWAVVDSWNGEGNVNGMVRELEEFDNRGGPVTFTVNAAATAAGATAAGAEEEPSGWPFPLRPGRNR